MWPSLIVNPLCHAIGIATSIHNIPNLAGASPTHGSHKGDLMRMILWENYDVAPPFYPHNSLNLKHFPQPKK